MNPLQSILMLAALVLSGQPPALQSTPDGGLDKSWRDRVVGDWRFEHRDSTKEGGEQSERSEIRFGKDGRYSAITVITTPVDSLKLQSGGTYVVTAIDASRARIQFVHESRDPSVRKDELTETIEVSAKDKATLVFPGNAILTAIP